MNDGAEIDKLLKQPQLHGPWLWRLMAHPVFYPKLESLSSASSPRFPRTLPHLPLTPTPDWRSSRRETSSAKSRSVNEAWPNKTKVAPDPIVLSSSQSMTVANESGASAQPCRTPDSSVKPWALDTSCPNTADGMIIEGSEQSLLSGIPTEWCMISICNLDLPATGMHISCL